MSIIEIEKLEKEIKSELFAFFMQIYTRLDALQRDLNPYIEEYNNEHPENTYNFDLPHLLLVDVLCILALLSLSDDTVCDKDRKFIESTTMLGMKHNLDLYKQIRPQIKVYFNDFKQFQIIKMMDSVREIIKFLNADIDYGAFPEIKNQIFHVLELYGKYYILVCGSNNEKENTFNKLLALSKYDLNILTEELGTKEEKNKEESNGLTSLDQLIGLYDIKHDVEELYSLVRIQKIRKERGLPDVPVSMHLVFTGNPGTGKTTVARIIADLYKEIGILKKGQYVEVERADLVAGYVGQTALKTQNVIDKAIGGVLFIDEAYTLAKEGNDFGQEAIDTILKSMEDHRDELVVIVAGYKEPMKKFINSNPGLKSRFNKYFDFPDYSLEELSQILFVFMEKYKYRLSDKARKITENKIKEMKESAGASFANARDIRNYFEKIISKQAHRIATLKNISDDDLMTLIEEDVV